MSPLQFFLRAKQEFQGQSWCLAFVAQTRGATPRKTGALMGICLAGGGASRCIGSIGGGAGEALVIAAAEALLQSDQVHNSVAIDLTGHAQAAGICGGTMQVHLYQRSSADGAQLEAWIAQLQSGQAISLLAALEHNAHDAHPIMLQPMPQLVIAGAGHCGLALAQLVDRLGFSVLLVDDRAPDLVQPGFAVFAALSELPMLYQKPAPMCVLLTRSFAQDLALLEQIANGKTAFGFIGMMGSTRRIHQVRQALSAAASALPLKTPVGINIGAQTPDEIAISIAAELIQYANR
jgi:xanthine dehydrogenase accessory factor